MLARRYHVFDIDGLIFKFKLHLVPKVGPWRLALVLRISYGKEFLKTLLPFPCQAPPSLTDFLPDLLPLLIKELERLPKERLPKILLTTSRSTVFFLGAIFEIDGISRNCLYFVGAYTVVFFTHPAIHRPC